MKLKYNRLLWLIPGLLVVFIISGLLAFVNVNKDIMRIDKQVKVQDTTENTEEPEKLIYTVAQIYENKDKFIGQQVNISGYMCTLSATNMGIAWLSDIKEGNVEKINNKIRMERETVLPYTPKAIIIQGILEDEDGLVIKDIKVSNYTGNNMKMLMHNELVDMSIVDVTMNALRYDYKTSVATDIDRLIEITDRYEEKELSECLIAIKKLASYKNKMQETEYEEQAEQLWNELTACLLNRSKDTQTTTVEKNGGQ